jgi:hypothetical protein
VIVYVKVPVAVVVTPTEPEGITCPDQAEPSAPPPLSVHAVAFVDDHVRVKDPPIVTADGLADRLAVGDEVPTLKSVCALTLAWFGSML